MDYQWRRNDYYDSKVSQSGGPWIHFCYDSARSRATLGPHDSLWKMDESSAISHFSNISQIKVEDTWNAERAYRGPIQNL